jgi:hypothetical protein
MIDPDPPQRCPVHGAPLKPMLIVCVAHRSDGVHVTKPARIVGYRCQSREAHILEPEDLGPPEDC